MGEAAVPPPGGRGLLAATEGSAGFMYSLSLRKGGRMEQCIILAQACRILQNFAKFPWKKKSPIHEVTS